jgi:hypothetical protein
MHMASGTRHIMHVCETDSLLFSLHPNRIRPFLINSLHRFRDLRKAEVLVTQGSQSVSQQAYDDGL